MPINNDLKDRMLAAIALTGASEADNAVTKQVIGSNLSAILNTSSGLPRIHNHVASKFSLILSKPEALAALSPFEIRCCLCKKVISYPCWYHHIKYTINNFHYFVCFDSSHPEGVTAKCFKRKDR